MKLRIQLVLVCIIILQTTLQAQNPIVPNRGVNDPHIHIYNNKAYLYATHDRSIESTGFAMDD